MGEFSPIHWLIIFGFFGAIPWLLYRHGKKVGDQQGYIRGYKEGQASKATNTPVINGGTF